MFMWCIVRCEFVFLVLPNAYICAHNMCVHIVSKARSNLRCLVFMDSLYTYKFIMVRQWFCCRGYVSSYWIILFLECNRSVYGHDLVRVVFCFISYWIVSDRQLAGGHKLWACLSYMCFCINVLWLACNRNVRWYLLFGLFYDRNIFLQWSIIVNLSTFTCLATYSTPKIWIHRNIGHFKIFQKPHRNLNIRIWPSYLNNPF